MVYPVVTEFYVDGDWTEEYSHRVRADGRITINRGQGDQQSSISPQTSDFTLNSADGLFSNRNPASPLYRKFGRNTQVRHSVLAEDFDSSLRNTNTGFETNVSGWTGFGGSIAHSTTMSYAGTGALKLTPDGVSATARTECDPVAGVSEGRYWTVAAYVSCANARNVQPYINWYDSDEAYLSTASGSTATALAANTWTRITTTAQAPASAAYAALSIDMASTPVVGDVLHVDEATVRPVLTGLLDCHFLKLSQSGGTWFSTADKAVLDITGDIDIRFEITPETWRPNLPQVIGGKWNLASQQSWLVTLMPSGLIRWNWSPNGTTINQATSAAGFGAANGRYALRVTLDVDNGSGQRVTRFYWATSIDDTWNLLGSNTGSSTTSIFNSTTAVELAGANANGSSPFASEIGLVGKVHAFELYNGIAGTLVADFDATVRSPGDTTWSDGLGTPNTWTLNGTNGRVTSDRIRFCGELSSLPQEWDTTGRDVYLPIRASGALRRMMQGGQPLRSAIYRNLIQYSTINGYWPMEAESSATLPDDAVGGNSSTVVDASFSGTVPDGLDGSGGRVKLNGTGSYVYLFAPGPDITGSASLILYFKLEDAPATDAFLFGVRGNGTANAIDVYVTDTEYAVTALDYTGATLDTQTALHGSGASPIGQWVGMSITLTTDGSDVNWEISWHAVGSSTFYTPALGGQTFAGTVGRFNEVRLDARGHALFSGAEFAHVLITRDASYLNTAAFASSSTGHTGELAGDRLFRLAAEEGLSMDFYGYGEDTLAMGPQTPAKVLDLFIECAVVDGGVLAEARDIVGLQYVTRHALAEQSPLTLDYSNHELAATPHPVDDDRYVLNDVTVSRPRGSSARVTLDEGTLSTQDPPDGVGRYEGSISKNVSDDTELQAHAEWEVFWRTWDEARIPNVVIGLHREPFASDVLQLNPVLAMGVGSPVTITDLPSFLPPGDLRLVSFGYTEVIEQFLWTITYNTVPYGPYTTARIGSDINASDVPRMGASTDFPTVLVADESVTSTSFDIDTPTGYPKWANSTDHSSEFPHDAMVGGERVTVTACTVGSVSGANWRQTLTVTRGVDGVSTSHFAGDSVDIADQSYLQIGA